MKLILCFLVCFFWLAVAGLCMAILVSVCHYCCAAVLVLVLSSLFIDSGGSGRLSGVKANIRDRLRKDSG